MIRKVKRNSFQAYFNQTLYSSIITLVLCLFTSASCAENNNLYSKIEKDVHYEYRKDSSRNVFDLYFPAKGKKPYPTHIYIHGGGWVGGSKGIGGNVKTVFRKLAKAGFLGIAVEYRLANRKTGPYLRTCVVDCMDALRYIFSHAKEYNIDTNNVFVWGGSAGGQLSLLCATAPSSTFPGGVQEPQSGIHFKGVVAWYPPTDMLHYEEISVKYNKKLRDLSKRIGRTVENDPVAFIEVSPLAHLTQNDPVMRIFHGDHDTVVNIQHSIRFADKAKKLGVPCELIVIKNANHGFSGKKIDPGIDFITNATAKFFIDLASKK